MTVAYSFVYARRLVLTLLHNTCPRASRASRISVSSITSLDTFETTSTFALDYSTMEQGFEQRKVAARHVSKVTQSLS